MQTAAKRAFEALHCVDKCSKPFVATFCQRGVMVAARTGESPGSKAMDAKRPERTGNIPFIHHNFQLIVLSLSGSHVRRP